VALASIPSTAREEKEGIDDKTKTSHLALRPPMRLCTVSYFLHWAGDRGPERPFEVAQPAALAASHLPAVAASVPGKQAGGVPCRDHSSHGQAEVPTLDTTTLPLGEGQGMQV
jgi:hypothetical protein